MEKNNKIPQIAVNCQNVWVLGGGTIYIYIHIYIYVYCDWDITGSCKTQNASSSSNSFPQDTQASKPSEPPSHRLRQLQRKDPVLNGDHAKSLWLNTVATTLPLQSGLPEPKVLLGYSHDVNSVMDDCRNPFGDDCHDIQFTVYIYIFDHILILYIQTNR